jgi:hypothetical protein
MILGFCHSRRFRLKPTDVRPAPAEAQKIPLSTSPRLRSEALLDGIDIDFPQKGRISPYNIDFSAVIFLNKTAMTAQIRLLFRCLRVRNRLVSLALDAGAQNAGVGR